MVTMTIEKKRSKYRFRLSYYAADKLIASVVSINKYNTQAEAQYMGKEFIDAVYSEIANINDC